MIFAAIPLSPLAIVPAGQFLPSITNNNKVHGCAAEN